MTTGGSLKILGLWFEANVSRVLRARARWAAGVALPAGAMDQAFARCLSTLRPRNRWPENTRVYAAIRARLTENPVAALAAFGAAAAAVIYLGFGQAAVTWLGALLRGPV